MDCSEVRKIADDYVFGLLDSDVEQELTSHINSCHSCARIVNEARARRGLFSAWEIPDRETGVSDRLLARIRAGKVRKEPVLGARLVRILATAAVILAAVILPRLFLFEYPRVLSHAPEFTAVEGDFLSSVRQELIVPGEHLENACLVIRLKSSNEKSPVKAAIRLNGAEGDTVLSAAAEPEELFVLTHRQGLKAGVNSLAIDNLGMIKLEFEITLVTQKTQ